ncbi:AIPR family protein [Myxococcus xanthus]|uniref:AIPR family protein n=1 Tax=Myxococcus xanthus TaxID=34 RepID=UPI0019177757|nr:AIPR family protein [Myxococcus xanthus]QQR42265.1 AIPR family protein [Myxococcus xanthus]
MAKIETFDFVVRFARRIPDPVDKIGERHILICRAEDVPQGLPKHPNPRSQKIDRGIWIDIQRHLLNREGTPNTFHLKNKGVTLVARSVEKLSEDKYRVAFNTHDGILDGAHTYDLITTNQDEIRAHNEANPDDPIQQYVKIEVLTGIDDADLLTELAGGLNTAVQVQKWSLENLKGKFDWIKEELQLEPYFNQIAFRENETGAHLDVRDVIVLLDLVNVFAFPNTSSEHPVRAYTSKSTVLAHYVDKTDEYEKLRPILKDVLKLYDIICAEGPDLHNDAGGKAGKLAFVETRTSLYSFPFMSKSKKVEQRKKQLVTGAAYPMLAAFRWCVEVNPKTNKARWTMPFKEIYATWQASAAELMKATQMTSVANGRKANAIGRNGMHWGNLHNIVAKNSLMRERAAV